MGWDSRELLNRATWPQSLCYSCRYQHLVVHVWSPMAATRAEGRAEKGAAVLSGGHRGPRPWQGAWGWHPQQAATRGRGTGGNGRDGKNIRNLALRKCLMSKAVPRTTEEMWGLQWVSQSRGGLSG